jgi:hypothetical protein
MAVNLLKTAAGLQEIDQLIERQAANKITFQGKKCVFAYTRYKPKRADEILESSGSIYWILKNRIQVRQTILGFADVTEDDGFQWCQIIVNPVLHQTIAVQKRAIQGWRYLEGKNVPKDRGPYKAGQGFEPPPPDLEQDLKKLGLL